MKTHLLPRLAAEGAVVVTATFLRELLLSWAGLVSRSGEENRLPEALSFGAVINWALRELVLAEREEGLSNRPIGRLEVIQTPIVGGFGLLRLEWAGTFTEGRFVSLEVEFLQENRNEHEFVANRANVAWNSGTGRPSQYLGSALGSSLFHEFPELQVLDD